MDRDIKSNIKVKKALIPTAISSATTTAGDVIDTLGFKSLAFAQHVGVYSAGKAKLLIEHSDNANFSSSEEVSDDFLIGLEADTELSALGVSTIGYVGKKRYVKASVVTTTSTTVSLTASVLAILGDPTDAPVVNNGN